jgi:hypothetical protein
MTPRTARTFLFVTFDRPERAVIAVLAAGCPTPEREVIARARRLEGQRDERRHRRALARLLHNGVLERAEQGVVLVDEPELWRSRIPRTMLDAIDAQAGPTPRRQVAHGLVPVRYGEARHPVASSALARGGRLGTTPEPRGPSSPQPNPRAAATSDRLVNGGVVAELRRKPAAPP